jgi:hypothetical protein
MLRPVGGHPPVGCHPVSLCDLKSWPKPPAARDRNCARGPLTIFSARWGRWDCFAPFRHPMLQIKCFVKLIIQYRFCLRKYACGPLQCQTLVATDPPADLPHHQRAVQAPHSQPAPAARPFHRSSRAPASPQVLCAVAGLHSALLTAALPALPMLPEIPAACWNTWPGAAAAPGSKQAATKCSMRLRSVSPTASSTACACLASRPDSYHS